MRTAMRSQSIRCGVMEPSVRRFNKYYSTPPKSTNMVSQVILNHSTVPSSLGAWRLSSWWRIPPANRVVQKGLCTLYLSELRTPPHDTATPTTRCNGFMNTLAPGLSSLREPPDIQRLSYIVNHILYSNTIHCAFYPL